MRLSRTPLKESQSESSRIKRLEAPMRAPRERTATTSTEAAQLRADEKNKERGKKNPTGKDKERSAGSSVHSYFTPSPSFHLGGNVCFPPSPIPPPPPPPPPRLRRAGSRRRAISGGAKLKLMRDVSSPLIPPHFRSHGSLEQPDLRHAPRVESALQA